MGPHGDRYNLETALPAVAAPVPSRCKRGQRAGILTQPRSPDRHYSVLPLLSFYGFIPTVRRALLLGALAFGVCGCVSGRRAGGADLPRPQPVQLMRDPGFESLPIGDLPASGRVDDWEVQRTGRPAVRDRLIAAGVEHAGEAKSGKRFLSLTVPKDTVGFEFVTVGQRVHLTSHDEYEASVWVRWQAGPDRAQAGATPTSGHPSAIVSFWARHRDGYGTFAGRDAWLFDNGWRRLSFRFRATDPDERTFIYVSLLPNQTPADTMVAVDDFEVSRVEAADEEDARASNLVGDSGFEGQQPGPIARPWSFVRRGGSRITGAVVEVAGQRFVTLAMPAATSNFESAQLSQTVDLRRGVRYEVSSRIRWDGASSDPLATIANYGIFHEPSQTWYGPIDQMLEAGGGFRTYRFSHIPPFSGPWRLYVQLNGWGNFGHPVSISIDDLTCTPAGAYARRK